MNEFVEACRREWKRLGVADDVAEEMATEVMADLAEADAERVPVEDVVGIDARVFANDWATARGVIRHRRRIPWAAVAVAALALVAIAGGVLVMTDSTSSSSEVALVRFDSSAVNRLVVVAPSGHRLSVAAPPPPNATTTTASILLFGALAAIVLVTLFWLWPRRQQHRPAH
jgi:anti-sigma-K factor RskA